VTTDGTNVYVGETNINKIDKIVIATGVMTVLAGTGSVGSTDGPGASATFQGVNGLATDGINVYVADAANNKIRQIVIATGVVSTLAGTGVAGSDDGPGSSATFSNPSGVATDGVNVYVADQTTCIVRQIVIATGVVTTLADSSAAFSTLTGIATDGTNVYVADFGSGAIRQIVISTKAVSTLATGFTQPDGVATDGTYVYVADTGINTIKQIVLATKVVSVPGSGAALNGPYELAVSTNDRSRLFVANSYGATIRLIQ
jgi:hypothetical protein